MATNCCLIGFPIFLCTLLILFQVVINRALRGPNYSCGCACLPTNDTTGSCKKVCGLEYSTPTQAVFCAISNPIQWPAALQIPSYLYRAVDEHDNVFPGLPDASCRSWGTCPVSLLYTGRNLVLANDIASGFFLTTVPSNISDLLRTLSELVPGTIYGIPQTNYLEPAFSAGHVVYILQSSCSGISDPYYNCMETLVLWRDNSTIINKELYQGYQRGNPNNMINEISAAFDFGDTSSVKLDVTIWYNDTLRKPTLNKPPGMLRLPRSMNLVAQAYLRHLLGSSAQLPLWFVSEMPKSATALKLDFSSLLGPLFFMWVIQLLLPVSLSFCPVSTISTRSLGLKFYCKIAFCFFFILIASVSVVGYQYVFGFGLLGAFLFQFFVEDRDFSKSAVVLMELLPGFSLYRGLYELSQYSLIGLYQGTKGMQWRNMEDEQNGMRQVFAIMFIEWLMITPISFYLDRYFQSNSSPNHLRSKLKRLLEKFTGHNMRIQDRGTGADVINSDVLDEKKTVKESLASSPVSCTIICDDLRKVYWGKDGATPKYAVRGLSLAVPHGQCFGMLGPNGAGKTSSINMLIGLSRPSSGTAYIQGLDIRKDMDKIHLCMGVCPQFDLLWESLTGREHLLFYGRLKNLQEDALKNAVDNALRSVNLLDGGAADKTVDTYSGGMKRRLSVAISLIGDPKVVYMDEPSAGLDPASRNLLWNVVKKAKQGRAIILTTHSMEEAEALCDRVGIFVKGRLQCIGNCTEMKLRYGGAYVFTISTPPIQEEEVLKMVHELSPSAKRIYSLAGTQKFEISKNDVTIADAFRTVVSSKDHLKILAWGFTDTTLEDVFIKVVEQAS
ncbi:hypothetical protein KP509_33G012600, partial [Ceratopteris richardii]